ncbi:MAG: FGGY-family carbohydrate kinase [Christensenella sp.]
MKKYIIAYDFGTGGIKASLYDANGASLASSFEPYDTLYPHVGRHEQRPADWWASICVSTKRLLEISKADKNEIEALAISGHSLGVVPIGKNGELLRDATPIWSDSRAQKESDEFFAVHNKNDWYMLTGNGFPSHLYSAFKLMWYRKNEREMFDNISMVLGTKDYINYLLTGKMFTDPSYASGIGFYDLKKGVYDAAYMKEMELPAEIFPEIVPSTHIIGTITKEASAEIGLPTDVKVACGGVDNSCMALGGRCIANGRAYVSLGSSAWNVVSGSEPILDTKLSPFVFAHCIPGMFVSATSIFAAGSSFQWVRNNICRDLMQNSGDKDPYVLMNELAALSPIGSHKLLFNPSLAGGTGADCTPNIRGAYVGLDLKHTPSDLIRAAMEGIALALRVALDYMKTMTTLSGEILFVGGGANSPLWLQMFADIYGMDVIKTNVGQEAGSLGAAAIAAVGCGMWKDFSPIDKIHKVTSVSHVNPTAQAEYNKILEIYKEAMLCIGNISDKLHALDIAE